MMRLQLCFALSALLLPVPAMADSGAKKGIPSGEALMAAVENRDIGTDQISTVTLEIRPKSGTKRLRRMTLMRRDYSGVRKLAMFFQYPNDVRNSAFLVWDHDSAADQRWLYLPSIGQVRRVSARNSRQSFFGSDFVLEDLTNRDPTLDRHKVVASQKVDGWDCWVVDSTPKNARGVDFAKYRSWVWKKEPILIRQEFFNGRGKVIRRGQTKSLKKIHGIWTLVQVSMSNLETGSQSRMQLSRVRYNVGVPSTRLDESQLKRGAPKMK